MYCDVINEVWNVSINNPHVICVWPGFCLISIKDCSVLQWVSIITCSHIIKYHLTFNGKREHPDEIKLNNY